MQLGTVPRSLPPVRHSLRIGFDGRALSSPAGGVRRYTRELFRAVATDPDIRVVAIGGDAPAAVPPGVTVVRAPSLAPTNLGWTALSLPLAIRRAAVDLYHGPAYTAPPWGWQPIVLTIHDCSYARHPEWYPYRRDILRRAFYRRSALVAQTVITDSEFSRREITAAYPVESDRLTVIPLGVGPPFVAGYRSSGAAERVTGIHGPYALHVGDLHPRRDLMTALQAVLAVRARHPERASLRLLLVGVDRGSGATLRAAADGAGHRDALDVVSSLDDAALARLYAGAAVFVYPSVYEGFGLPMLEAMACGVPVVAARAAASPEVLGDAGLLVEPGEVAVMADAIEAVLSRPDLAARLRATGRQRAARFTWERAARETIQVYRRCLVTASGRRFE